MVSWPTTYDKLFQKWADTYDVDWLAIKAQACAESRLDPLARSPVGALGLMQFMPATWGEWCLRCHPEERARSRIDPEWSIELGTAYMADLLRRFGDYPAARAAYNWGMGNVRRHLDTHGKLTLGELPRETQDYLTRIKRIYGELLAEGA